MSKLGYWGLIVLLCQGIVSAETLTVSGKGQAPVPAGKKKDTAAINQQALAVAQQSAVADAVAQALFQVYGNRQKLGAQADSVIRDVVDHSAAMILDTQVKSVDVQGAVAVAEVILKIDGKAMRDYLEHSLGLSLTQENEGKFRTFVLAYTVEGMDPNRAQPQVLREEVTDNRKNIHDTKSSSAQTNAESEAASYALDAAHASSDQGSRASQSQESVDYQGSAKINASASERAALRGSGSDGSLTATERAAMNVSGSASEKLSASQSSASGAEWDRHNSGSVKEQASAAQDSFRHEENAKAEFSDTSTAYHKLVVYSDTTKKGAGGTNEVRAKLGEILKTSGLMTNFYDINLMGREFSDEDALYHEILSTLQQDPSVKPEDCMAVEMCIRDRRRARAARPVAGQCEGPERARRGYKPLDHFTDEHAPSRRSYVTTPRGVAHFRPARFVAGGQLGSGQSTDESGSTHGNVKGPARTCGNFMCPASKSGLQNDATISAD